MLRSHFAWEFSSPFYYFITLYKNFMGFCHFSNKNPFFPLVTQHYYHKFSISSLVIAILLKLYPPALKVKSSLTILLHDFWESPCSRIYNDDALYLIAHCLSYLGSLWNRQDMKYFFYYWPQRAMSACLITHTFCESPWRLILK